MNIALATVVLKKLAQAGVEDIIVCAGARNSPFVFILEKIKNVQVWNFFDERSAGFYALGLSQKKRKPVAVITTSGTAVAELLPAAVEATYTQTPLIFVTADRPRAYRGTGAPQSIDQVGIFSSYVETCFDIARADEAFDFAGWTQRAPLQINVSFAEPLIDAEIPILDFKNEERSYFPIKDLFASRKIVLDQALIIAGSLNEHEIEILLPHLLRLGAPIYAEAQSNLRNRSELKSLLLNGGEKSVEALFKQGLCKSILRIGGVPTLRFWRDLEDKYHHIPVSSVSSTDYTGLSRSVHHVVGCQNISFVSSQWTSDPRKQIFSIDEQKKSSLRELLDKYPKAEASLFYSLVRKIGQQNIYVGNSLPIRELDLISGLVAPEECAYKVSANRGANGIDGQISSFLGLSEEKIENWALVGDLTALYDLSSLWVSPLLKDKTLRIVIINNRGGQIFKNIFKKEIFVNSHDIQFSHWAKMWNWNYQEWKKIPEKTQFSEKHLMIELLPDVEQTDLFWRDYQSL
jgi:2-succinyl-5-enolpyruvyl-6-hydroxy-3-cyclohexene-1-carboxylate synthase